MGCLFRLHLQSFYDLECAVHFVRMHLITNMNGEHGWHEYTSSRTLCRDAKVTSSNDGSDLQVSHSAEISIFFFHTYEHM